MSWSIHFVGKPANILKALADHSDKLTGQSKEEFDKVLPSLVNLVEQCYYENHEPFLSLSANGHASAGNSSCQVNLKHAEGTLV
jgi:hypothetical protein